MADSTLYDPYRQVEKEPNSGAVARLNKRPLKVGVVFWEPRHGLAAQTSEILVKLGHQAIGFSYDELLPEDLDLVFLQGPFGSLVPIASQMVAFPAAERPRLVWWLTEQLPNPRLPEWLLYWLGRFRSDVERAVYHSGKNGRWRVSPLLRWLVASGLRFRYYGDLCWLREEGVLSMVVTGSPWRAEYLRRKGFDPYVPPSPNNLPNWGADLNLERDIPVLWLGKIATLRRKRLLRRVRRDLRARGVELYVVDGVERPYIFKAERTRLLNRTRIVLNLLRAPWDNNAARYALAAQNRALLVSEPTLPHSAFQPGVHVIEAPIDRMADTICYYLEHEAERRAIAERAYQLIMEHSREDIIAEILQRVLPEHRLA